MFLYIQRAQSLSDSAHTGLNLNILPHARIWCLNCRNPIFVYLPKCFISPVFHSQLSTICISGCLTFSDFYIYQRPYSYFRHRKPDKSPFVILQILIWEFLTLRRSTIRSCKIYPFYLFHRPERQSLHFSGLQDTPCPCSNNHLRITEVYERYRLYIPVFPDCQPYLVFLSVTLQLSEQHLYS